MTQEPEIDLETVLPEIAPEACLAALKPLARRGAFLARLGAREWGLYLQKMGPKRRGGNLPVGLVIALEKARLIEFAANGSARISKSGKIWLTRHLANSERSARRGMARGLKTVANDGGNLSKVLVNLDESPLERLRSRRGLEGRALISQAEFEAGERLRRDFTKAELMPKVTATWSSSTGTAKRRRKNGLGTNHEQNISDAAYAARKRVAEALSAVGPEFETILLDTCCFLRGVEASEVHYGWPRRSAKLVLKLALSALARHYWAPARATSQCLAGWSVEGARPVITAHSADAGPGGAAT